jgi:hypothetical protein
VDNTHGPFKLALTLSEFVAATPEAHRGLVGHLASLSDQVQEIQGALPADNAWLAQLKTGQNLRPGAEISVFTDTAGVANGLMLRITDVKLALESLPVAPGARGEVALEVDDALLPANARPARVSAREGRLKVGFEPARSGARTRLPRLRLPAEMLGPILAGTLSPVCAAEAGFVESTGGAAELIESWFRARAAYLYPLNGF